MMASHILMSRVYDSGTCRRRRYFCRISTSSLDVETSKNLYPPSPEKNPEVSASSSDGLLCLKYSDLYTDTNTYTYIVWNPSSNEFKSVPDCLEPTSPCHMARTSYDHREHGCSAYTHDIHACGLGFDHRSNDYKFIQFRSIDFCENPESFFHSTALQVAVYSLKKNSWKDITDAWNKAFPGVEYYPCFGVFDATDVSGRLYWFDDEDIISFDLADEEFSTLPFPDVLLGIRHSSLSLMELHGALAVVNYTRSGVDSLFVFCVWETETETWTRKTCYEFCAPQVERPMGFCRNYELFLLRGFDGKLLAYDYTLRELKKIHQIYDYPVTNDGSYSLKKLFPYVENTLTFHGSCQLL